MKADVAACTDPTCQAQAAYGLHGHDAGVVLLREPTAVGVTPERSRWTGTSRENEPDVIVRLGQFAQDPHAAARGGADPADTCGPCRDGRHDRCYAPCACAATGHHAVPPGDACECGWPLPVCPVPVRSDPGFRVMVGLGDVTPDDVTERAVRRAGVILLCPGCQAPHVFFFDGDVAPYAAAVAAEAARTDPAAVARSGARRAVEALAGDAGDSSPPPGGVLAPLREEVARRRRGRGRRPAGGGRQS